MTSVRPTRAQLILESQSDLQSRIQGGDAQLPRSVLIGLATMLGAALDAAYGMLQQVANNILPDTSDDATLLRQASQRGLYQELATPATGNVIWPGNVDADFPAGTLVQRSDGAQFTTNVDAVVGSGGTVTVAVTASVAGSAGNTPGNAAMTLGSSVPGMQSAGAVDANGLTGGADIETIAALRAAVIAHDQEEATGGNLGDYVAWAKQIPGVTRAWAYKQWAGPGTVGLTFVLDNDPISIIPQAGDVANMQAHIDALAPAIATNVVFAPTPVLMNPAIHLIGADSTTIRAAVTAELAALITSGVQSDGTLGTKPGGTTTLNQVIGAINAAEGVDDFELITLAGVSPANLVMPAGSLLGLGAPVFS